MPNDFERFLASLRRAQPDARVKVDLTEHLGGPTFADISVKGRDFTVEWTEANGFILEESAAAHRDESAVHASKPSHALEWITAQVGLAANRALSLAELRLSRGMSQMTLAEKLGIHQSTLSQLEKRANPTVESLAAYFVALGGRLRFVCDFADRTVEVRRPESDSLSARSTVTSEVDQRSADAAQAGESSLPKPCGRFANPVRSARPPKRRRSAYAA